MIVWPDKDKSADASSDGQPAAKANSASLPKTAAGLIRAALTGPAVAWPPETLMFQLGDRDWWRGIPSAQVAQRHDAADSPRGFRVALAESAAIQRNRALVRPSGLEGGGRIVLRDRLSPAPQSAMERGTLLHAFLERIGWIEDGVPDDDQLFRIARGLDADPQRIAEAIHSFRVMIGRPSVRNELSRGVARDRFARRIQTGTVPVHSEGLCEDDLQVCCEQRLSAHSAAGWISGNIDRLVLFKPHGVPLAADLIDFKTDAVPSAERRAERVAFYRPQLLSYVDGLSTMLRIDKKHISAQLLFLADGSLVSIS
jgi:hypothetical protein